MRKLIPLLATAGLLASCGPKTLALPDDPIDRAATCGIVAAADARARQTGDVAAPLPLEAQGRILHYALLTGEEGETFSQERVTRVVNRMPELEKGVTGGKWQDLVPQCAQAFPQTAVTEITLPENRLDAQTSCYVLSQFMAKALAQSGNDYIEQLTRYGAMNRKLDDSIGAGFRRTGVAGGEAQQAARKDALGEAAKLGSPTAVLETCVARFG